MKAFCVRAEGAWFSRVIRVFEGNVSTSSSVSAYSSVKTVLMGGKRLYQPLREGDVIVREDGVELARRPPTPPMPKNLVIEQHTEPPILLKPEEPAKEPDAGG